MTSCQWFSQKQLSLREEARGACLEGNMGIKDQARFGTIFAIDLGRVATWTTDRKTLSVRRGCGTVAPMGGERMPMMIIDDTDGFPRPTDRRSAAHCGVRPAHRTHTSDD